MTAENETLVQRVDAMTGTESLRHDEWWPLFLEAIPDKEPEDLQAANVRLSLWAALQGSLDAAVAFKEAALPNLCVENWGEMRDSGRMTGHWLCQLGPRGPRKRLREISVKGLQEIADGLDVVSAPTPALALVLATLKALEARPNA